MRFNEKKCSQVFWMALMFQVKPLNEKPFLPCGVCTRPIDLSSFVPEKTCCKELIHKECYYKLNKTIQAKMCCPKCYEVL